MVFVSATRLKVRSFVFLPTFFMANEASLKFLLHSPGFITGKELLDKHLVFWTLTAWQDEASMKNFRNSAPHRKAMQKLPVWCSEAAWVHWEQETEGLPGWHEIYKKMIADGTVSKVRNPSPAQAQKKYPPVKWVYTERKFKKI